MLVPRAAFAVAVATAVVSAGAPRPLHGVPLGDATGIKLLIASDPPFLFDVDTGKVTHVTGIDGADSPTGLVLRVGTSAVIWVEHRTPPRWPKSEVYVLRRGETRARRIATGTATTPASASDGAAVWIKAYDDPRHCSLRKVALTGKPLGRVKRIACATSLVDTGGRPMLWEQRSFSDPETGRRWSRKPREYPWVSTGRYVVTGDDERLRVIDVTNSTQLNVGYPGPLGWGMDNPAVQPGGRLVALGFSTPALNGSGTQATDIWLFDPASRRLRHLPGMPITLDLKFSSMAWTADGRLVLLVREDGRYTVAVWRTGQKQIATRRVRLPIHNSGSDAFVVYSA